MPPQNEVLVVIRLRSVAARLARWCGREEARSCVSVRCAHTLACRVVAETTSLASSASRLSVSRAALASTAAASYRLHSACSRCCVNRVNAACGQSRAGGVEACVRSNWPARAAKWARQSRCLPRCLPAKLPAASLAALRPRLRSLPSLGVRAGSPAAERALHPALRRPARARGGGEWQRA